MLLEQARVGFPREMSLIVINIIDVEVHFIWLLEVLEPISFFAAVSNVVLLLGHLLSVTCFKLELFIDFNFGLEVRNVILFQISSAWDGCGNLIFIQLRKVLLSIEAGDLMLGHGIRVVFIVDEAHHGLIADRIEVNLGALFNIGN